MRLKVQVQKRKNTRKNTRKRIKRKRSEKVHLPSESFKSFRFNRFFCSYVTMKFAGVYLTNKNHFPLISLHLYLCVVDSGETLVI